MATITESFGTRLQESISRRFHWQYFLQDNITGSWLLTVWVIILTLATILMTVKSLTMFPLATTIMLVAWFIGILLTIFEGLHIRHSSVGRWLKANMLNSVSNTLLTLFLVLVLVAIFNNIWQWAVVNATFSPEFTEPQYRNPDGATWGVIGGAWNLLMVGRFPRDEMYRVGIVVGSFIVMAIISFVSHKIGLWQRSKVLGRILTGLWIISPIIVYILLAGVPVPDDQLISITTGASMTWGRGEQLGKMRQIVHLPKLIVNEADD